MKKVQKTNNQKVVELFERLAGDKLYKVSERVVELQEEGKSHNRAMADALFEFKCIKNDPKED